MYHVFTESFFMRPHRFSSAMGRMHRALSRCQPIVEFCAKLRNQCTAVIGYHFDESGDFERDGEAALIRLMAPHCSTFADVGANRGDWTDLFVRANQAARGLVLDPAPAAFQALRRRFSGHPNLEILQLAGGDEPREATLFAQPNIGVDSSLVLPPTEDSTPVSVRVTTLDHEVGSRQWDTLDFLKIDAEGYDFRVIQGARQLLTEQRIGVLQFEYSHMWPEAGSTLAHALQTLKSYGYESFLLRSSGLHAVNYKKFGEYCAYSNYVAVSPHQAAAIGPLIQ